MQARSAARFRHVFFILAVTAVLMNSIDSTIVAVAPERAAALTGVRSMFRLTRGVLSVTGISLALTFFPDRGQGLSVIFGALSVAMLLVVPLMLSIPDSARERRLQHTREPATA